MNIFTVLNQAPFDVPETIAEALASLSQGCFGVEIEMPRQIRQSKEQIAEFVFLPFSILHSQRGGQFRCFLFYFFKHFVGCSPIESDACRLFAKPLCLDKG